MPVGLSLLGTQSANGTISLKDARTVGVDTESLHAQLHQWAEQTQERRDFLANFGANPGRVPRNYLRVVSRVYLLGEIDVQLNDARSVAGGVDVGMPRPVELFLPRTPTGIQDTREAGRETYLRGIERLNAMGGTGTPLSATGAEPDLTASEFAERQKAREGARAAEVERATTERDTARTALNNAKSTANTSAEGTALATAKGELVGSQKALQDAREKRDGLLVTAPPADERTIAAANDKVKQTEEDVQIKEAEVAAKQKAFDEKHAPTIQAKAGEFDVKEVALNRLQGIAPGGSFRFTAASARSVSLTEIFATPMVVGYLGFDVPIGVDGELGRPIPTHALLTSSVGGASVAGDPAIDIYRERSVLELYKLLSAQATAGDHSAQAVKQSLDRLTRFVPERYPQLDIPQNGPDVVRFISRPITDFGSYHHYAQTRRELVAGLNAAADRGTSINFEDGATKRTLNGDDLRKFARSLAETSSEARAYRNAVYRLFYHSMQRVKP